MRVALRDAQHAVVDAELARVRPRRASTTSSGSGTSTSAAQQHELHHALAGTPRSRRAMRTSRTPPGRAAAPRRPGPTKPVIDSVTDSISTRCRLVSPPAGATAAATPPAMMRASAASGGCRSTSSAVGSGTGMRRSTPGHSATPGRARSGCRTPSSGARTRPSCRGCPGRGASSITRWPCAFTDSSACGAVGDAVTDVVQALALAREVLRDRRVVARSA